MPPRNGPEGLPIIPAMTTDAERECYYRLTSEGVGKGEIVELGAWLGASTAYIAAAIRDSGVQTKAHVFDKFQLKPGHANKVEAFYSRRGLENVPLGPCMEEFERNLGPLLDFVDVHQGQIEALEWNGTPISVLITDAPKRVPQISSVLGKFRKALGPGSVMAWQDFCHFPSYEIPACLYRLRHHIEFTEAVVPGTTLVFRVTSPWKSGEVSTEALSLDLWSVNEIAKAWDYWLEVVPAEKSALFSCGAAMFLCDIGKPRQAVAHLANVYRDGAKAILSKWQYLKRGRPDFVSRYQPLFEYLARQGAFEKGGSLNG